MINDERRGGLIIFLSFVVAFMLTAMPLPEWAVAWRPVWVVLVLIYWCMALPDRVGIATAWCVGLLLDVQQGTLLGQHALGLAIVAFVTLLLHQRVRVFSLSKQAVVVSAILFIYLVLTLWVRAMIGYPPQHWNYWLPLLTSMLLWPWLFIILRDLRRKYRVSA